jgi:hypothetical protein
MGHPEVVVVVVVVVIVVVVVVVIIIIIIIVIIIIIKAIVIITTCMSFPIQTTANLLLPTPVYLNYVYQQNRTFTSGY